MEKYSVLMSVYCGEKAADFEKAVASMIDQTVVTDDFVIVCDGPLTPELDTVIQKFTERHGDIFNIVRLPENKGIGEAANIGLQACKNDLVAKMDADDISVPDRCEKQLKKFDDNRDLAVLGGYIEEFDQDPDCPFAVRSVPDTNEEIRHFARRRQPFNNMTVMYRRSAVLDVGGYRPLRRNEDYDLYVRLLHKGYHAENLPCTLVKARVDQHACQRRASWETLKGTVLSRWNSFRLGYSSVWDLIVCCGGETLICICPGKVQQFLYQRFLRQDVK